MVGYVVEIALKARICKTLKWKEFPSSASEFRNYSSFKVHSLPILLKLSGREEFIRIRYLAEWGAIEAWHPETRYRPIGLTSKREAERLLAVARTLLKVI